MSASELPQRFPNSLSPFQSMVSGFRPFIEGFQQIYISARWALKLSWATHAKLITRLSVVTLIQGMVPAAMALIVRGLINAAVAAKQQPDASFSFMLPWIGLGIAITILESVGRLAQQYFTLRLNDDLTYNLTSRILQHSAQLDVATFESPRSEDLVHRAQQNVAIHFAQFLVSIFSFANRILEIGSLTIVLIVLEPLTIVILLPLAFLYLLFQWDLSKREYIEERNLTTKRRWTNYYTSLLMGRHSVSEIKMLNLAPLLLKRCQELLAEFHNQSKKRYARNFLADSLTSLLRRLWFMVCW